MNPFHEAISAYWLLCISLQCTIVKVYSILVIIQTLKSMEFALIKQIKNSENLK